MPSELIVFPDVVPVTMAGISARLAELDDAEIPVVGVIPDPRPAEFVRVIRAGGAGVSGRVIDSAFVLVEAWAGSDARSGELAGRVRAIVHAMAGEVIAGATVYEVVENAGPANLPDPDSHQARHTMTFAISVRGRA